MMLAHNSFSSQTWAIFVPNRNSKIKSTVWPTGPPQVRSQNKAYWPYLIKIKEKVGIFAKFGENLLNLWLKIDFIELLCFKCFQNCPKCAFKHIWKPKNLIWKNEFWPNIGILTKSLKLTSHFGWTCKPHNWLNFRVQKLPISEKRMSHWSAAFVEFKTLQGAPTESHLSWNRLYNSLHN